MGGVYHNGGRGGGGLLNDPGSELRVRRENEKDKVRRNVYLVYSNQGLLYGNRKPCIFPEMTNQRVFAIPTSVGLEHM